MAAPRSVLLIAASVAAVALIAVVLTSRGDDAHAQGFAINTTADGADKTPGDGQCETDSLQCTLRAAIQETNALGGPDSITVPGGTYTLTGASGENMGASGDLDITSNLTIEGAGAGQTIVDAAQLDRAFDVVDGGATVSISGLTMRNGRSDPNDGGGVHNEGTLTLSNVSIENSHGDDGGAIVNFGTATVLDSVLKNNTAADTGGAIINHSALTVRRTAIDTNTAPMGGGGVNNLGNATISESLFAHGRTNSGNGAGLLSFGEAGLTNVTFSDNEASQNGGAIASESSLALSNVTITDNSAGFYGGGLYTNNSGTQSRNTIIAGNTGGSAPDQCYGSGGYISQGNNISSDASCLYLAGGDRENTNPMLGPLANNGGPTQTHALLDGSVAINGTTTNVGCPPTDQRGVPRPQNGQCDIGAFEVGALPTPTPTATNTPEATPTPPPADTPTSTPTAEADTPTSTQPPPTATRTRTPTPQPGDVGDASCDGNVNSIDAALILQSGAGLLQAIPCEEEADTNQDGTINSIDAALILQYSAGLLDQLPP